ncbi:MAG: hypothetical protein LBI72_08310 [Flavobacteriaceae bacterium]|jgi:hypothetical protein|nr:hypothetical protein [Flavobacteriaceae bacterium]
MSCPKYLFAVLFCVACCLSSIAQESLYKKIQWHTATDTLYLTDVALNNTFFEIKNANGVIIPPTDYTVDFNTRKVFFTTPQPQNTVEVTYLELPSFLTQAYSYYPISSVVSNEAGETILKHEPVNRVAFTPLDGLNTMGSLSRGLTMGTNQSAVTSSNLDLQITGKLSDRVSIRASIQDNNLPLQYGGYSQKINEFDQIFMELFTDSWYIRAGDIFLENRKSRFLNFNKKVQGLSTKITYGDDERSTTIEAAAGLARGQYARSAFQGIEGNQGPYKLKGNKGELYILVIAGSEKVYINGLLLKRGEENDYVIDYNSGEIRFTPLHPITSEMRISIEYQYTDRTYTRYTAYGNIQHQTEKWSIGGNIFTESDLKNQPLQQNLTTEQITILQQAGNDPNKMIAPSAYRDAYTDNKILYKKIEIPEGGHYFVFSKNPEDDLYNVTYSFVGKNKGDYLLKSTNAIGKIYEYIAPINGVSQGSYSPTTKLIAPVANTIATLNGQYRPTEKTNITAEIALNKHDENLFSTVDEEQNKGWATAIKFKQRLWTGNKVTWDSFGDFQFIHQNFKAIENLFSIEFDRDWNVYYTKGNQSLVQAGLQATLLDKGSMTYSIENLQYGADFKGNRHRLYGTYNNKTWSLHTQNSVMHSEAEQLKTTFNRSNTEAKYNFAKNWVGVVFDFEDRQEKDKLTQLLSKLSNRNTTYKTFVGRGDSLGIYGEFGYIHRINDSIKEGVLTKTSIANTLYFKSQLIKNKTTDLTVFINHRTLTFTDANLPKESALNTRIAYNDQFLKGFILSNTLYETSAGNIAQQEFTYLEVEPGRGQYMWVDYNGNGIQELEEFELAPYPDLGKYVRMYLPNQVFLPTHQNKITQNLVVNPSALWGNNTDWKRLLSLFYNQASYSIDRKDLKNGQTINLNPFRSINNNMLGLNENLRNTIYYNRGKQRHSLSYTYIWNRNKNLLAYGTTTNQTNTHQLNYNHLIAKTWLVSVFGQNSIQETTSDSYTSKNYNLHTHSVEPRLSYLFTTSASMDIFYSFQEKKNVLETFELLKQHRLGASFLYTQSTKISINGELSLYKNVFTGNAYSPVGYQMLEGLQPGSNFTWRLMLQRNLTQYLDLSLQYQGRSNESTAAIHTGSVQLRAFF